LKVLECGVEERARKDGTIVGEMKKCYLGSRKRGIFYVGKKKGKAIWICHILRRNCLLKHAIGGEIEGIK